MSRKEELKIKIEKYINDGMLEKANNDIELNKKEFEYEEYCSIKSIIYLFFGNIEKALNYIKLGMQSNIFNSDLYFNMGMVYEVEQEYDRAYLAYEQAYTLNDNEEFKNIILEKMGYLKCKYNISVNPYSVIILTYNNLEYTKVCINSLRRYNGNDHCEIIIVDNNSTDGTKEWLKGQSDIKYILNDENMGFPAGCNQGIEIAEEKNDIFLLNNDTVIMPNSIFNLRMGLYSSERVGATGSVSNSVSNYQQVEASFDNFDDYINFAIQNNITNKKEYEKRLKLIGFAMMIKRKVLNEVGVLDERFTPGNFEDDDLSYRIINQKYELLLCLDSYIHHFGSVSFKKDNDKYDNLLLVNSQKFKEKWGFSGHYSSNIRFEIIDQINKGKNDKINILEIGCGCGATLLEIKNTYPNSTIHGIEIDEIPAQIASNFADVISGNVENIELNYEEKYFDYIIMADVLEHLINPDKVLKKIKKYLKDDGFILANIPNIMHFSIIKQLINGRWSYEDSGILDRTHLRFFTKFEILKMFEECGYINIRISAITLCKTEQDDNFISSLRQLSDQENEQEFSTYQYIVVAKKSNL